MNVYQHPDGRDAERQGQRQSSCLNPESGSIAFYTTMPIAKGTYRVPNAYSTQTWWSASNPGSAHQAAYNLRPATRRPSAVRPADEEPRQRYQYVDHDWAKSNPLRAA